MTRNAEEEDTRELGIAAGPLSARARGYRLIDLVWLPVVLGIGWIIQNNIAHGDDAKNEKAAVAKVLAESNKSIADALKDNNKVMSDAIKDMVGEQKKMVDAMREQNCLLAVEQHRRPNMAEFCKRVTR